MTQDREEQLPNLPENPSFIMKDKKLSNISKTTNFSMRSFKNPKNVDLTMMDANWMDEEDDLNDSFRINQECREILPSKIGILIDCDLKYYIERRPEALI